MLAILLICSVGQSPIECQRPTARSVLTHETEAQLPYSCLMEANQYAAQNSVTARLKPDEWLKIGCAKKESGDTGDDHL